MAESALDRAAFPLFFFGSVLMTLPAIIRYYSTSMPKDAVVWAVGIGFALFAISLVSGIFHKEHH